MMKTAYQKGVEAGRKFISIIEPFVINLANIFSYGLLKKNFKETDPTTGLYIDLEEKRKSREILDEVLSEMEDLRKKP